MYDIIIIGAGVTGCAVARYLSRYEGRMLVLEKAEDVCCGTSKANSAIVHAGFDAAHGSLMAKMNLEGNLMMPQLAKDLDFAFKMNGSLVVCMSEEDLPKLRALYENGVKNGVKELEIVDAKRLHELEPNVSKHAVAALWDAILKTVRVTGDGNAEARWREHIALLTARKEKLNALRFKSLHYTNSLGTDLTIELPDDHLWAAGNSETPAGVGFVANLPTEEIFTAPLRTGVNGTVCAALPLVNNGSIIEDIRFTVREGRIVEAKASRGEDVLNAAISVDDGARYFGEVALVPYDSPIRSSGLLFYNTLYDENASCHLAFGEAYPECIAGGERMTREELNAHGLNHSLTHVDFMVGTADLSITGTTHDGRELPVFRSGNFAL